MTDEKKTDDAKTDAKTKQSGAIADLGKAREAKKLARGIEREIDRWFAERIHASPVSRHTPSFNYLREALDDLKQRLSKL